MRVLCSARRAPDRAMVLPLIGPIDVVQADTRFCRLDASRSLGAGSSRLHYWWESARSNALWAARHGYRHRLYCLDDTCEHESAGRLYAAWCKLRALQDALGDGSEGGGEAPALPLTAEPTTTAMAVRAGLILFLDSDAFWKHPELSFDAVLGQYIPAADWAARGADAVSIFFGCNLPWNGEDRGRRQWNATTTLNGEHGPPGTGVMLLLCSAAARTTLREWWDVTAWNPTWNRKFAWEQSALWALWAERRDAARSLRVLHDEVANECMRSMDPKHPSQIVHVAGGMTSPARREARLDALGLRPFANSSAPAWCTHFTRLGLRGVRPRCATQRLDVSARGEMRLAGCERAPKHLQACR